MKDVMDFITAALPWVCIGIAAALLAAQLGTGKGAQQEDSTTEGLCKTGGEGMKTLQGIQTLHKLGRVLSAITFVCCVVGAVGCAVGMLSLPLSDKGLFKLGGVTIHSLIVDRADIPLDGLYPLLTGWLLVCIGHAVTAKFAERYFRRELAAQTPFTLSGARELLRLGILVICVPLGAQIAAQIVSGVVAEFVGCGDVFQLDNGDSVALGAMLLFMSLLCQYGAEATQAQ